MCMLLSMMFLVIPVGSEDQNATVASVTASARAVSSKRVDFAVEEMLMSRDFMTLFFFGVVSQGVGLMFINNLAVINKAVTMNSEADSGMLVAVFSVANTSGRIIYGYGSEAVRSRVNRPWFLSLSCIIICFSMLAVHLGESALISVSGLIGFALGGLFSLQAVIMEEVFGPRDLPLKYSCFSVSACLGSLVFNRLFGHIYDNKAAIQQQSVCLGAECYAATTYVCVAASSVAFVCTVFFGVRSRKTYLCLNDSEPLASEQNRECLTQMRSFSENT
eukprot:TRINITY_DN15981_c0_g1_i1.p1 TRINITY_DN15981_c0_g1~~TRINITY_DN15981_c0_g1_i1.p1  ORF type:complete len:276 (-),score=31.03 TRINITY_DN15981_c0_g1_i1:593-1420(-)